MAISMERCFQALEKDHRDAMTEGLKAESKEILEVVRRQLIQRFEGRSLRELGLDRVHRLGLPVQDLPKNLLTQVQDWPNKVQAERRVCEALIQDANSRVHDAVSSVLGGCYASTNTLKFYVFFYFNFFLKFL